MGGIISRINIDRLKFISREAYFLIQPRRNGATTPAEAQMSEMLDRLERTLRSVTDRLSKLETTVARKEQLLDLVEVRLSQLEREVHTLKLHVPH